MKVLIPIVIGLLVVGCGKKEDGNTGVINPNKPSPDKVTNQEPPGQANHKKQPTKILKPTIKLLDPGAEPRAQLRYSYQAESSGRFKMDMSMSMTLEANGMKQEIPMPLTRVVVSISCKASTPDGKTPVESKYDEVEILDVSGTPPELLDLFKKIMGGLQGTTTSGVMTPQGLFEDVDVKFPENVHPEIKKMSEDLKQTFNSLAQPFPKDAIGKGARWQVSMPFTSEGIKGTQVSTLTLKDIQGDKVKMELTVNKNAPKQEVDVPGLPGVKGQLISFESTGTGKTEISLTGLSDIKLELNETQNQTLSVNGTKMKMTMKIGLVLYP